MGMVLEMNFDNILKGTFQISQTPVHHVSQNELF